jgi:hypothetical protein
LRRGGQERIERQFNAHVGHTQTVKPCGGKQGGIGVPCVNMRKPGRDIAPQWHDLKIRPHPLQLRRAPRARRADARALLQIAQ